VSLLLQVIAAIVVWLLVVMTIALGVGLGIRAERETRKP